MIKNRYFILVLIVVLLLIKYNYNEILRDPVLNITYDIKKGYVDLIQSIKDSIDQHIEQKKSIERLQKEVKELKKSAILSSAFAGKLKSILEDKSPIYSPKLDITRAISYIRLADYNRVWLDFKAPKKDKIYGLLYQGYSAGIAINKDGKSLGLLQGDEKCIFSVYIGDNKIPGVIFGDKDDMIIRYIPAWTNVKVGDEVYTSGLDGIFFEGIKVGKVTNVIKEESYISAAVKPYAKIAVPGYFHIVTKP